jgi:hypothetical protein
MRSVMGALVLIGLPGAIFAPLIAQIRAVSFCSDAAHDGLAPLLDVLPPCPSQTSGTFIVTLVIASAAMVAWSLVPRR